MKKLMFVGFLLVSLVLIAEETNNNESNWISYDGWVTGPGANENNKYTYLLPFAYFPNNAHGICMPVYVDEHPLLYETDMGWPVPDEEENNLKYLFFGDTYFFMRDQAGRIMSKITYENETLLNFGVENNNATEIEKVYDFSPSAGSNLHNICTNRCLFIRPNATLKWCSDSCSNILNLPSYSDCFSACNELDSNNYVFNYIDSNIGSQREICQKFCMFDMVDTYASMGYFAFNEKCSPEENNDPLSPYNKGTSNIFLAAELDVDDSIGTGDETLYKVQFLNTSETGYNSAQLYETTSENPRRAKSIWMNSYERWIEGFVGIYPRGYFYACSGTPNDECQTKKLFVPYNLNNWDFFNPEKFGENLRKHLNLPETAQFIIAGNDLDQELVNQLSGLDYLPIYAFESEFIHQSQSLGIGIYNFDRECRIGFTTIPGNQFPSCSKQHLPFNSKCGSSEYPNEQILWPLFSKMSSVTVIHDISRDILSIDDEKYPAGYIYFMGTGEAEIDTSLFYITRTQNISAIHIKNGYKAKDIVKKTQKAYIARVPAYESEIMCPASYEYFKGITNGIARWSKNMGEAVPLYGFYPLDSMGAESIVKHRDLYWMTAPLNETTATESHENKKGVVVLASPDAFHWQKVDTILFDNPESIWLNYAFFWLPPKLINDDDNTMPFLYSIWKNRQDPNTGQYTLSGFLDDDLNPKFTRYNLKSGKYKFMEEKATRAFLVDNAEYGNLFKNNIPNNFSNSGFGQDIYNSNNGTIPLPFVTYQNLDNLDNTGLTGNELNEKTEELKNRYVIVEYCNCGNLSKEFCTDSETGPCKPFKNFVTENGNGQDNWKIIDIVEDEFFDEYVGPCKNGNENIPDYMCNIPFEHRRNSPKGTRKVPVWNWQEQISKDLGATNLVAYANVILRFSHWHNKQYIWYNFPEINRQLVENNKLIPYDCPDLNGNNNNEDLIYQTCQSPDSWKTTNLIHLTIRTPVDGHLIEYLYPYPAMISDFGKPGDPAPWVWDMLVADHFSREFFKVSSFEFGASVNQNLTSGAAATAVIKNGQMTVYAWGGTPYTAPRSVPSETLLYIGTYNPETEVVTFEQTQLVEREGNNSPEFTAGASMVYDDENDKIYLIGALDKNGTTRKYSLEDDNMRSGLKTWRSVTTIDIGRYFRLVKKSEHEYFAFGGETGTNTFTRKAYLLDLNNMASPQTLQDIPTSGLANSFAAYSEMDQKLYVFGGLDENGASDRFLSYDIKTNTWSSINVAEGPGAGYGGVILVDYITETMSLGGGVFVNNEDRNFKWIFDPKTMTWSKELKSGSYCLKEADSAIQGGMETSGTCVPFTHPFYNSFSAGTTVYSVAGKGDRLYAGTNDSIKIYDISDQNSPVLVSSFSTNNARVNDLEIEGDVLFAATSKGLYKLDTSDPDELEQILFVSTGSTSQNEIELYDGKVYVGDDNGIKIRDKETLSVLLSANSGQVYDFAIENGEIAMFRSSFWNSGIQFRNAETLVETAYDYTSCNDVEIENFNGKLYLACDNYNYSFEAVSGYIYFTQLSGDKRDLRENYTYNGYTYTPDGNYIRLSTNEEVQAICGNDIVEGDEVCDGTPIDCAELDESYVSGIAACNSTCDGYVLDNCTAGNGGDGW